MPVIAEGTYEVDVDLRKFDAGIGKSVDKAKSVAKAAERATADAAKAAARSAADASRSVATKFKAMEDSAKKAFEQIGGRFGSLGSAAVDLGKSIGAVGGPVLGMAALAAAAAGAAVGAVALANAAIDAKARLEELGAEMSADDAAAVEAYAAALKAASTAADQLKVAAGGEIASRLVLLNELMAAGADQSSGMDTKVGRLAAAIGTAGLSEAFIFVNEKVGEYADEVVTATNATREAEEAITTFIGPIKDWNDEVPKATAATKSWEAALRELIELPVSKFDLAEIETADEILANARATVELREEMERLADDGFARAADEADRLANEEVEGLIIQLGHVNDELEETAKLDFKQLAGALADIGNEVTDAMDPFADALSNMFDMADQRAEDAVAKLDKLKEKNKSIREEMRNTDDAATRASLQLELEANKVAQDQARAAARIRKQQALRAWRGEKAGNITMAIANGAVAVTQAFAQLGPIAGAFAAIGVAAATATQVGLIASQKPPQYHTGGRFGSGLSGLAGDEMQATVLRNEGAVTPRGIRAAGGDKGLRDLNKGRMPGGETVVHNVIQIGDRVIARETRRHTPGQLGQSNPHRR